MVYQQRWRPSILGVPPPAAPAQTNAEIDAAWIAELKRFLVLLGEKSLRDAIDTIETELKDGQWWSVVIIEGFQDYWSDWFDAILGEGTEWDETAEANKWIWEMWFTNEIARLELIGKVSDTAKQSDFVSGMLANLKVFRDLLDHMSLANAITKFDSLTKSSGWFSTEIEDLARGDWSELFERSSIDTESPSFNARDEKYLWLWKRFFDNAIRDMESPGKPRDTADPDVIDKLSGRVEELSQEIKAAVPEPGTPPTAEALPVEFPAPIPDRPVVPVFHPAGDLTAVWTVLSTIGTYLAAREAYETAKQFNIGWGIDIARSLFNMLKIAKTPGTQTEVFKSRLQALSDITFELETKGVFHD